METPSTKGVFFVQINMHDIKDFRIGKAYYIIENDKGSCLRLDLNYGLNKFAFKILIDNGNIAKLINQTSFAASYMLGKKAQNNLNYKLRKLKI